ncbi:MAG: Gfo/Idh/MocA family protein, partial [Cyclobacteriaceae bacterium]
MKTKHPKIYSLTRRNFVKKTSLGFGAVSMGLLPGCSKPSDGNEGETSEVTEEALDPNRKLGVALVGLGNYATNQLAPALMKTGQCYLSGIVTGTKEKEKIWQDKYSVPEENTYDYENYDAIADNQDIDIIYIVLPNSMHAEYTIRAAKAGKHVICEKPMAISMAECQQMIDACKEAGVKLSIGYRLHYEPFT